MATKAGNENPTAPGRLQFAVRLDPHHPGGLYRRAGIQFLAGQDVFFESVPEAIQSDPWLMVTKVEAGKPPAYSSQDRRAKQDGRRL